MWVFGNWISGLKLGEKKGLIHYPQKKKKKKKKKLTMFVSSRPSSSSSGLTNRNLGRKGKVPTSTCIWLSLSTWHCVSTGEKEKELKKVNSELELGSIISKFRLN